MSSDRSQCPGPTELSRALSTTPDDRDDHDDSIQAHLLDCPRCAAEWAALSALVRLGAESEPPMPDRARVEGVRTSLLAAAAARPARRRRHVPWQAAAAAAMVVAAVALRGWLWTPRAGHEVPGGHLATVQSVGAASYTQAGTPRDEVVYLSEGRITVEVTKLRRGERFRVRVGESEVEVRGTAFEVVAHRGRLELVRVFHGRVEVRPRPGRSLMLNIGQRWHVDRQQVENEAAEPALAGLAPVPPAVRTPAAVSSPGPGPGVATRTGPASAPAALPPTPVAAPRTVSAPVARQGAGARVPTPVRPAPAPRVTAPVTTPAEATFLEGWERLRAQQPAAAAEAFARASRDPGAGPLAEDVTFWHGVALARAERRAEAVRVLGQFLDRYPEGARRGEASSILGWLLFKQGALDRAEGLFNVAAQDGDPEVRRSAQSGLTAIAASRAEGR